MLIIAANTIPPTIANGISTQTGSLMRLIHIPPNRTKCRCRRPYSPKPAIFYHHKLGRVEGEVRDPRWLGGSGRDRTTSSSTKSLFEQGGTYDPADFGDRYRSNPTADTASVKLKRTASLTALDIHLSSFSITLCNSSAS